MKKNRILIAGLAAIAGAAMIGGTWAVWTQRLLTKNEFMTAKYSTFLEEKFEKPDAWLPGEEEQHTVWVKNESTIPIIAQITMNQDWFRREDVTAWVEATPGEVTAGAAPVKEITVANKGETLPLTFEGEQGEEFAAVLNFNSDPDPKKSAVVVLEDSRIAEAGLHLNIPSVKTLEEAEGKWLLVSEDPLETGNYTFYYMGQIQPGEESPILLSSVTMNPQLETTVTGSHTYFVENPEAEGGYSKVTVDTVNSKYGYDSSHYDLNISMKTVQATKDAIETMYPSEPITKYIAGYIAGSGVYEARSENTLYFEEVGGKMCYRPIDDISADGKETGNWFMSFTNMVPGGTYIDRLNIENGSWKTYDLYMHIVPREGQSITQEELLRLISMKVYYGAEKKPMYDGDATGYHYTDANGEDMQGLVYLGQYSRGRKEQIRVELQLDPNLGLQDDGTYKYADVLTKIDWEFMVTETTGGGGSNGGGSHGGGGGGKKTITDGDVPLAAIDEPLIPLAALPKTGDTLPVIPVAVTAAVSLLLMLLFAKLGFGKKKEAE